MTTQLVCVLSLLAVAMATTKMTLQMVTHDPYAVCIDGTSPGYYLRRNTSSSEWLIGLLGGGWCHSHEECAQRAQTVYGSSSQWPAQIDGLGLTSADAHVNPTFHTYNIAFLWYCDGSSYGGNLVRPYSVNGSLFYSRGEAIFNAVLDDLEQRFTVSSSASRVVLYGESAGGSGCWSHIDAVGARWPAVDVRGLCDSSFFIPVGEFSPSNGTFFAPTIKHVIETFNLTGALDVSCVAAHPNDAWKCLIGEYLFRYIDTPLFVLQSQVDCDQFEDVGLTCLPAPENVPAGVRACNATELAYIKWFQSQMRSRASLAGMLSAHGAKHGLFFDSCIHHSIALFGNYWNNANWTIGSTTAASAVKLWLDGKPAVFADADFWPPSDSACVSAFDTCLGDRRFPPWQCGPANWQAHDC
jgi:hypothetical protein